MHIERRQVVVFVMRGARSPNLFGFPLPASNENCSDHTEAGILWEILQRARSTRSIGPEPVASSTRRS
jgi:hypothetical protein